MRSSIICILMMALAGCSPVMEATRPDPVDVSQFVPGEDRLRVIAEVGTPLAREKSGHTDDNDDNAAKYCEVYKLFTKGPGAVGKGALAATEAVADVLTLGLAEIITTPAEAATRNSKHTVIFCYDQDNKLVSVTQSDTSLDN